MKCEEEILERICMFEKELEKHMASPECYEENFTKLIEHSIDLLKWVKND